MVEHSGTGGYDHEIPKRVSKLETSVDRLHSDTALMQTALARVEAAQDGFGRLLSDVAQKLDQQRTKRPEMGAMAGVVGVIIMLGGAVLWPINQRLNATEVQQATITAIMIERAEVIGQFRADKNYMLQQIQDHHKDISAMKSNRFTKEDGQRLEDKVDKLHSE